MVVLGAFYLLHRCFRRHCFRCCCCCCCCCCRRRRLVVRRALNATMKMKMVTLRRMFFPLSVEGWKGLTTMLLGLVTIATTATTVMLLHPLMLVRRMVYQMTKGRPPIRPRTGELRSVAPATLRALVVLESTGASIGALVVVVVVVVATTAVGQTMSFLASEWCVVQIVVGFRCCDPPEVLGARNNACKLLLCVTRRKCSVEETNFYEFESIFFYDQLGQSHQIFPRLDTALRVGRSCLCRTATVYSFQIPS